jgi:hypothetical protein
VLTIREIRTMEMFAKGCVTTIFRATVIEIKALSHPGPKLIYWLIRNSVKERMPLAHRTFFYEMNRPVRKELVGIPPASPLATFNQAIHYSFCQVSLSAKLLRLYLIASNKEPNNKKRHPNNQRRRADIQANRPPGVH